ncbi:MAG: hypothetical protein C4332_09215 [Meiothermus sp.]
MSVVWERIDEYANFRLGDAIVWLTEGRAEGGVITEMVESPGGPVFWLTCAPFWVRPEQVRHSAVFWGEASGYSANI